MSNLNDPNPSLGDLFGNFTAAKNRKAPPWAFPLLVGSACFVTGLFLVMWISTIWQIDQLDRPKNSVDLAVAPPPPPPPPPPPGGAKPHDVQIVQKKIQVKDIVQPVKVEKQDIHPQQTTDQGDPNGEVGGEAGGVAGGVVGGVVGEPPPPPPPPPPPAPPQTVPPTMLEGSRISGEKEIMPDATTATAIQRSGKDRLVGSFKICLTVEGTIASVNMIKSTGFPEYDNKITSTIRGQWRYHPYNVNGKAVPVCTAVTFIYRQQ